MTKTEEQIKAFNDSVQAVSDSWPPCLHCGQPVDDLAPERGVPMHHYWTESVPCIDKNYKLLATTAEVAK